MEDQFLQSPDLTLFVDGSLGKGPDDSRHTAYVVVTSDSVLEANHLPQSRTFQKLDLYALIRVLTLARASVPTFMWTQSIPS